MTAPRYRFEGHLDGNRHTPLDVARLCHGAGWRDLDLVTAVAVCGAESAFYERAYNDKYLVHSSVSESLVSRDIGLFQISVIARQLDLEFAKYMWDPERNVTQAYRMWKDSGWQPWYAYTNHIATNPKMAGRYIQRAAWAVHNLYREQYGLKPVPSPYIKLGPTRLEKWARQAAA